MPLINFQTDLTSLPWGRDRRESGKSKQPYLQPEIPEGISYDDMPGRGLGDEFFTTTGFLRPRAALRDVSRLFQMFFDFKSPRGPLFIVKQNLLSLTAVKTQAGGPGYGGFGGDNNTFSKDGDQLNLGDGGALNQGIYLPTSTILQALGPIAGGHLNLLGIDPTQPLSGPAGIGDGGGGFFGDTNLGLVTYTSVADQRNNEDGATWYSNNRLTQLYKFHTKENNFTSTLYTYQGGPGSILGIGKTRLPISSERTGLSNPLAVTKQNYFYGSGSAQAQRAEQTVSDFINPLLTGAGMAYANATSDSVLSGSIPQTVDSSSATTWTLRNVNPSVYQTSGSLAPRPDIGEYLVGLKSRTALTTGSFSFPIFLGLGSDLDIKYSQSFGVALENFNGKVEIGDGGPYLGFTTSSYENSSLYVNDSVTYNQKQLLTKEDVRRGDSAGLYPTDFRKELYTYPNSGSAPSLLPDGGVDGGGTGQSTVISHSPNYRLKNKDVRLNQGQPGKEGGIIRNSQNRTKNVWNYGIKATELEALDKITAMPMYDGTGPDVGQAINDLCKFRIAAINNDKTDGSAVYMHFRAFLNQFDDNYSAAWNPVNYVGRGDTLYSYGGFNRSINLGFTVAAQSKAELIPMYKKLNYLASTLAPDYTSAGFMRGNLVRLTVGGYIYEQPGFITALNYTVPQESTWEIGIDSEGGSDSSVKELPHIIQVSGFSFTPIHTFLPEKPNNARTPNARYISLSNGVNSNYNDIYEKYQPNAAAAGDGDNNSATN